MYPIIILEGPDGSGKSTLASKLKELMGAKVVHCSYRFKDQMPLYHWAVMERALKDAETQPVIIDRWWPSEYIYSQVFRHGPDMPMYGRMLDRVALKHRFLYVLCLPDNKSTYISHFNKLKQLREEQFSNMNLVYDLYAQMKKYVKGVGRRDDFITYDMFVDDPNFIQKQILERSYDNVAGLPKFATDRNDRRMAGNPFAKVVLCGDVSNPKGRHKLWPFFEHANSSLWITKSLATMGVGEFDLCWLNMWDDKNKLQWTRDELEWFEPDTQFIPMGTKAFDALEELDIYVQYAVPHPQWFNRFRHDDLEPNKLVQTFKALNLIKETENVDRNAPIKPVESYYLGLG